jgi:hypothetical protein
MLTAFAMLTFSDVPDSEYTFDFAYVEKQKTVQATLEAYTARWADAITLVPVVAWEKALQSTLESWLFDCLRLPEWCEQSWRANLVGDLLKKIEQLVQPTTVWRVTVTPKGFYELHWEDFALESERAVFYLHLGFSDQYIFYAQI